ncbi:MAG: hypothetical protein V1911_02960 [Candidatus Micrarchaeota archaeon]
MNSRKGAVDFDFIIAFVIFIIMYIEIVSFLPYFETGTASSTDPYTAEARYLSDLAVKNPGYPANWATNAEMAKFGLSYYDNFNHPNILDYSKVSDLTLHACADLTNKTGMNSNVNWVINVDTNTTNYNCSGAINPKARQIERPVYVYNGSAYESAVLRLYIW